MHIAGSMNSAIENICKTCNNSDDRLKVAAIDMLTCLFDHSSVSNKYYLLFIVKYYLLFFILNTGKGEILVLNLYIRKIQPYEKLLV